MNTNKIRFAAGIVLIFFVSGSVAEAQPSSREDGEFVRAELHGKLGMMATGAVNPDGGLLAGIDPLLTVNQINWHLILPADNDIRQFCKNNFGKRAVVTGYLEIRANELTKVTGKGNVRQTKYYVHVLTMGPVPRKVGTSDK